MRSQLQLQGGAGGDALEVESKAVGPARHAIHVLAGHTQVVKVGVRGGGCGARLLGQRIVVAVEEVDGQSICVTKIRTVRLENPAFLLR